MNRITKDTKPIDIENLTPFADYLMYKCVPEDKPAIRMTFAEMNRVQPAWNVDSMIRGMTHLSQLAGKRKVMYDVYSEAECLEDVEKKDVKVFFLPAERQPSEKPFIVCVAGGAYSCVCSVVESFPTAARFNALGYNVFVLNYRVSDGRAPVLPKPEEDLASAVKLILTNKDEFGLVNMDYVVNGFSAGGNVTAIFGTEKNGYAKYGCPHPKALFTIYPAFSTSPELMEDPYARKWFLSIMFGPDFEEEYAASFDVPDTMTDSYPPCFVAHAEDDPTVSVKQAYLMEKVLQERHIPAQLEIIPHGGHGWGDGSGTDAAGWPDRAVAFLEDLD